MRSLQTNMKKRSVCAMISILNESSLLEKTFSCAALQKLSDTVTETIKNAIPSVDFSLLQDKLDTLSKELEAFKGSHITSSSSPPNAPHQHPAPHSHPPVQPIPPKQTSEKPFEQYQEGYLTESELDDMADLLGYYRDSAHFIQEKRTPCSTLW